MWIGRLALVMLLSAPPASAHALLERAIPSAGGEVAMSPPEIVLTFTERVEPLFSTIELRNPFNPRGRAPDLAECGGRYLQQPCRLPDPTTFIQRGYNRS